MITMAGALHHLGRMQCPARSAKRLRILVPGYSDADLAQGSDPRRTCENLGKPGMMGNDHMDL